MIVIGERGQTPINLQTKLRGNIDNFISFITEAGISNINDDITGREFNLPANNNNSLVYNLGIIKRNVVTGSNYDNNELQLSIGEFNDDYNEDYM